MLNIQRLTHRPRRPNIHVAPPSLVAMRQRLNWRTWSTGQPIQPEILTSAELSECTCPEMCHRDHQND